MHIIHGTPPRSGRLPGSLYFGRVIVVGLTILCSTIGILLMSCSQRGGTESKVVTLRMLVNITPVLTQQYYQDLVAPYEKAHPDVHVVIEMPVANNVIDTLQQELAAGTQPDIINQTVPALGKVLATFPDEEWVRQTPFADELQTDGRQWEVAVDAQVQSLVFYNKTAFRKAGIRVVPTTVAEFTADLIALKAAGYVPLATAGEWVTGAQFSMLANPIVMQKDPNWFSERNAGTVSFARSYYKDYLRIYKSWISAGLVPKDANGLKYQDSIDEFTSGKAATYVMGNWVVPSIDAATTRFETGVFAVPSVDGSPVPLTGGPSTNYAVLKASKNQAAAFDLIHYLVSDKETIEKQLRIEGNFRAGYSYKASALTEAVAAIVDKSPGYVVIGQGHGRNVAPPGYGDKLNQVVQGLYLGDSAENAVTTLDQWWTSNATK